LKSQRRNQNRNRNQLRHSRLLKSENLKKKYILTPELVIPALPKISKQLLNWNSLEIVNQPGSQKGNFSIPIIYTSSNSTTVCQINVINF
jgi:hypothetical protein